MREMSNRELFDSQQKKLKKQENDIDEIIGYSKEGKDVSKELQMELIKQNKHLDDIEKDVIL